MYSTARCALMHQLVNIPMGYVGNGLIILCVCAVSVNFRVILDVMLMNGVRVICEFTCTNLLIRIGHFEN